MTRRRKDPLRHLTDMERRELHRLRRSSQRPLPPRSPAPPPSYRSARGSLIRTPPGRSAARAATPSRTWSPGSTKKA